MVEPQLNAKAIGRKGCIGQAAEGWTQIKAARVLTFCLITENMFQFHKSWCQAITYVIVRHNVMISDTIWDWVAGQIATYDLIVCSPHKNKNKRVLIRQCDAIQTFLDNHRWFDVCEFCISGVKLFNHCLANSWILLLGTEIVIINLTVLKC